MSSLCASTAFRDSPPPARPTGRCSTAGRPTNALAAAAERTGGLFLRYDPAAATGQLDQIRAAQQARGADEQRIDAPVVVLIAALMLTALLGISLLAVRR